MTGDAAGDAYLYLQVTRGAEFGRNHAWPADMKPTMFAYITALDPLAPSMLGTGRIGGDGAGDALGAARHQIDGAAREHSAQEIRRGCRRV